MQTYFIGIKGTKFFCYDNVSVPACMCSVTDIKGSKLFCYDSLPVPACMYSVTNNWLYVAFSSRVESGSDDQKFGSIGSLDGSSGSYQQIKLFGCYLRTFFIDHMHMFLKM